MATSSPAHGDAPVKAHPAEVSTDAGLHRGGDTQTPAGTTRRRAWRLVPDVTALVTLFLALQFLIPARLVISGLGSAGRPSNLIGLGLFLLVLASLLQPAASGRSRLRQPVTWIVVVFAVAQLVTYAAGVDRGLPGGETRSADRWLLLIFAMVGVALAVAWEVPRGRLLVLLRRLTGFAGAMALVGLIQGVTGFNPVQYVSLPGLTLNANIIGISSRGGLPRVAGTAAHYIELGVVSAMILPLAIHFLVFARSRRQQLSSLLVCFLLLAGMAFSLSRSAILSFAVAMLVLLLGWSWRWRLQATLVGLLLGVVLFVASSRWVETMLLLFTGSGEDPSIQTRLQDYPIVLSYFVERPWLGRGAGTFGPDDYVLLDNQYLGAVASSGLVGLLALVLLYVGPVMVGLTIRARADDDETRHLALALIAGMAVVTVASATFDSFAFTTFTGAMFVLVGSIGALHRTTTELRRTAPRSLNLDPTAGARP